MDKKNNKSSVGFKRCRFCQRKFQPHPKVGQRQWACSRFECQRARQKHNQIDWLERNPVDYQKWYQDYGKAWRQKHPDYQRNYRNRKRAGTETPLPAARRSQTEQVLRWLLRQVRDEKKEQLTHAKTVNKGRSQYEKKEQLTPCFYLLKADNALFLPLAFEKKEQLTSCFH